MTRVCARPNPSRRTLWAAVTGFAGVICAGCLCHAESAPTINLPAEHATPEAVRLIRDPEQTATGVSAAATNQISLLSASPPAVEENSSLAAASKTNAAVLALELPELKPEPPPATNEAAANEPAVKELTETAVLELRTQLKEARRLRAMRQPQEAAPLLVALLAEGNPEPIVQLALLELAAVAQDENNPSRAQQIYAQFIHRWPADPRIPEILLRQGDVFRQMGLNNMALTKFYAVMTSALVLKNDEFDYYASLVSRAQTEIAETHFQLGKHAEAADFLTRLLKQDNPALNKSQLLYKLLRSQLALARYDEAAASGLDYLLRHPNAPERAEVQFHLASALKQLGRDNEALTHVLNLLREQRARANERPEVWAYWQQRAGNVIANQLYREGDYSKALDIYTSLAQLDNAAQWQLPVTYQIGMTYERLMQPQKAVETYTSILSREKEFDGEIPASLQAVFEMARWRIAYIEWQEKAEALNRDLRRPAAPPSAPPLAAIPPPAPALP